MNRTKIEYLEYTWNPLVGCSGVGCSVRKVCWARGQAKRAKHRCKACYEFVPHVHWERFEQPFHVKKSARIGVCFMGEFFDKGVANWVRKDLYLTMLQAPQHTYLVLTKQPQNIDDEPVPENVWLGVSVNTKHDLWRVRELQQKQANIKFISFEPLYERIDTVPLEGIDWIIIGAQTRPLLLPHRSWVTHIICEAKTHQIPVFMKNNLLPLFDPLLQEYPKEASLS